MTCERTAVPKISWELHSALSIGALATATPCARLHARNVVCEWGLHDIADAVELVVSELVTNAVKASIDDDGRPRYSAKSGLVRQPHLASWPGHSQGCGRVWRVCGTIVSGPGGGGSMRPSG